MFSFKRTTDANKSERGNFKDKASLALASLVALSPLTEAIHAHGEEVPSGKATPVPRRIIPIASNTSRQLLRTATTELKNRDIPYRFTAETLYEELAQLTNNIVRGGEGGIYTDPESAIVFSPAFKERLSKDRPDIDLSLDSTDLVRKVHLSPLLLVGAEIRAIEVAVMGALNIEGRGILPEALDQHINLSLDPSTKDAFNALTQCASQLLLERIRAKWVVQDEGKKTAFRRALDEDDQGNLVDNASTMGLIVSALCSSHLARGQYSERVLFQQSLLGAQTVAAQFAIKLNAMNWKTTSR